MSYNNAFINAVSNLGHTENGALSYTTTNSAVLDYFFHGAVTDKEKSKVLFSKAFSENRLLTMKIAFYIRDIRQGQGKRDPFRSMLEYLKTNDVKLLNNILPFIPLVGRWKDVFENAATYSPDTLNVLKGMIEAGVEDSFMKGLVGKWLPRKGDNAKVLTKLLGLSEKQYRKLAVSLSNTVEQKMCAQNWNEIDFAKLPSRAAKIYQKAFMRNAQEAYQKYVDSLQKGENKVNASTLYPSDISTAIRRRNGNVNVLDAQWDALPDYMQESERMNVFPVIDLSGSMGTIVHGNTQAMDVAIGLGLYLSTHNRGAFKDLWCNFSDAPKIYTLKGKTISEKINNLDYNNWGGSTNIQSVFDLVLSRAVQLKVPEEDMPKVIVIVSDMQFNMACGRNNKTNFEIIKDKYAQAGYKMPTLVFWNAASRSTDTPVSMNEEGVILVGGYSPSLMKNILENGFKPVTPFEMMLNVIQDKYTYLESIVG